MSDAVDIVMSHYGVPGMKWGRRKASSKSSSSSSSPKRKGGLTPKEQLAIVAAGATVLYGPRAARAGGRFVNSAINKGVSALGSAAAKQVAKRGAKAAANAFADGRGLTSYSTLALKLVDGVYR